MILTPLPLLTAMTFLIGHTQHSDGPVGRDDRAHVFRVATKAGLSRRNVINDRRRPACAGVAGFVGAGDRDDIAAMTRALAHRGPDGEGLIHRRQLPVYLGHRRLAIIDLAGGEQPMWNEDGNCRRRFQRRDL